MDRGLSVILALCRSAKSSVNEQSQRPSVRKFFEVENLTEVPLAGRQRGPSEASVTDAVSLGLKLGWGVGSVGSSTAIITVNIMLLYYMVTTLEISPVMAGAILAGARLVDMALDPLIGLLRGAIL